MYTESGILWAIWRYKEKRYIYPDLKIYNRVYKSARIVISSQKLRKMFISNLMPNTCIFHLNVQPIPKWRDLHVSTFFFFINTRFVHLLPTQNLGCIDSHPCEEIPISLPLIDIVHLKNIGEIFQSS